MATSASTTDHEFAGYNPMFGYVIVMRDPTDNEIRVSRIYLTDADAEAAFVEAVHHYGGWHLALARAVLGSGPCCPFSDEMGAVACRDGGGMREYCGSEAEIITQTHFGVSDEAVSPFLDYINSHPAQNAREVFDHARKEGWI